jgi:hypothetical protein
MMMQRLIMTQVDDLEMDNGPIFIIHNRMRINTLYLPGFSHRLCGSRARPAVDLAATPLDGLAGVVARFIPAAVFAGVGQRRRVFTPWVTFCAFLGQRAKGQRAKGVTTSQRGQRAKGVRPLDARFGLEARADGLKAAGYGKKAEDSV